MKRIIVIFVLLLLVMTACTQPHPATLPSAPRETETARETPPTEEAEQTAADSDEAPLKEADAWDFLEEPEAADADLTESAPHTSAEALDADPEGTELPPEQPSAGIRPDFQEAMDSYEAFFDEYCTFMKTYQASDNALEMLPDYLKFMEQYTETMHKMEAWEDEELSDAELLYYLEVSTRIQQKLLEVAE